MAELEITNRATQRRALLLGTGGTIAMVGRSLYDWVEYGESGVVRSVEDIMNEADLGLPEVAVELVSVRLLPSTNISWADWVELARLIRSLADSRADVDGIVISHGTASLEDTAWFLELVSDISIPVVVVGAQRPPNTAGSDAVPNLRAALAVATARQCRDLGVMVVMNNQVFAARDVRKASNFGLDAFAAPEFGPLGRVEADGTVVMRRHPTRRPAQVARKLAAALEQRTPARVDIAFSYPGADGTAIRAFQQAGAKAIVSLGMVPGRCTPNEREALREAVRSGVVVVQSSRSTEGAVVPQRYNAVDGIESGGDLAANKMRILLLLALTAGLSQADIREVISCA